MVTDFSKYINYLESFPSDTGELELIKQKFHKISILEQKNSLDCDLKKFIGIKTPLYGIAANNKFLWILEPDTPYYPVSGSKIYKIELMTMDIINDFQSPSYGCRGLFFGKIKY